MSRTRSVTTLRSMTKMNTLVSFDVDGTLVESIGDSASKLHRASFAHCFKTAFNLETDIDAVKHQGSTDPLIIMSILEHHGLDPNLALEKMPELMEIMVEYFMERIESAGEGLRVLPGVDELLSHLKDRGDVATCLVTGNLQPIGWGKMQALGLHDLFTPSPFGGFGSDFCSGNFHESWKDRAKLIEIANEKAMSLIGSEVVDRFHIGDAPMDMMAAKKAGVKGIGVTTGIYTKETLLDAGAWVVLEGLYNLEQVLNALQLN
eukprot:g9259.t3